jgi:hypothetical protein
MRLSFKRGTELRDAKDKGGENPLNGCLLRNRTNGSKLALPRVFNIQ